MLRPPTSARNGAGYNDIGFGRAIKSFRPRPTRKGVKRHPIAAFGGRDPIGNLATIAQAMTHPAFELDANEAAGLISAFNTARAHGYAPDPFTIALVLVLKRQLAATFENSDNDNDDDAESEMGLA